jgi:hypothetical protein
LIFGVVGFCPELSLIVVRGYWNIGKNSLKVEGTLRCLARDNLLLIPFLPSEVTKVGDFIFSKLKFY